MLFMSATFQRRWLRFSLRAMLIGVAALSAAGGYVVHEWRIVKERQESWDATVIELESQRDGCFLDPTEEIPSG